MDDSISALKDQIEAHLLRGDARAAADCAQAALIRHPDVLEIKVKLGLALEASGDRPRALEALQEAHDAGAAQNMPTEFMIYAKHSLAAVLNGARRFEESAQLLREAIALGGSASTLMSAAVHAFIKTGAEAEARECAATALTARDIEADIMTAQMDPVPADRPTVFDPDAKSRNIISYSLFGTNRYYHECALVNARIVPAIHPEFTPRFYCREDVPTTILDALVMNGAQVKLVRNEVAAREGLFWRFWAFDDKDVDVVLVRDVDSPLSARERGAVEDWLYDSDAPFHVMRDHIRHCTPMMAGLWGGFTKSLPPLQGMTRAFLKDISFRYADQRFLRFHIWPRIRDAALAHDSHFSLRNSRDFPAFGRTAGNMHVGWAWPSRKKPAQPRI